MLAWVPGRAGREAGAGPPGRAGPGVGQRAQDRAERTLPAVPGP